jgi:hypothetical protein
MRTQSPELKELNALAGKWRSRGEVKATPGNPSVMIKGTDTYEWVCEGQFLFHEVDVLIGEEKVEVIEMICYDLSTRNYPMRSFDNQGNFTTMQATVDAKGVWKLTGDGIRSTLVISKDGNSMQAHWERSDDGLKWLAWMEMEFTKTGE